MALNGIGEIQTASPRMASFVTPMSTFGSQLQEYGAGLQKQALLEQERARQIAQDAENQRRWDIANQRAEDEAARIKADRKAQQAYFNVLGQGPQTAGGSFASPELSRLAEQSAFTQAENPIVSKYMQAAGGNDQAAMDAMRRDNLGPLADKLKTQLDISNAATKFADTGMGNESRVAMLERAISEASKFGVPSKDMYTQLDQARLAEQTAKQDKLKDIMSQEADIEKNRVSNLKWGIDKMSGGGSDGVASGVSQYTAKDVAKGTADIQKQLSTALKTVPDEKAKTYVSQLANTEYNKLLEMGINPSEAAGLVSSAISSKSNDEWYKFFQNPEAVYKKDTISSVLPQYLERAGMQIQNGKIVRTKGTGTSKEESAAALVNALSASDTAKLANLKAQREQLNKTPQEVYGDKIRQLLGEAGYGNTVSPSNAVPSGLTTSKPSGNKNADNVTPKVKFNKNADNTTSTDMNNYNYWLNNLSKEDRAYALDTSKISSKVGGVIPAFDKHYAHEDLPEVRGITLHRTAGDSLNVGDSANQSKGTGAHYTITKNGDIVQYIPENKQGWHAGQLKDANASTLGIEVVGKYNAKTGKWDEPTQAQRDALIKLQKDIASRYKLKNGGIIQAHDKVGGEGQSLVSILKEEISQDDNKEEISQDENKAKIQRLSALNENGANVKPEIDSKYQSVIDDVSKDLKQNNGGIIDEYMARRKLITQLGIPNYEAKGLVETLLGEDKKASDANIARRNYLIAQREGSYQGKTADQWYEQMSGKDKAGTKGWLAPFAAASGPIAGLVGSIYSALAPTAATGGSTLSLPFIKTTVQNYANKNVIPATNKLAGTGTKNVATKMDKLSKLEKAQRDSAKIKAELDAASTTKHEAGYFTKLKERNATAAAKKLKDVEKEYTAVRKRVLNTKRPKQDLIEQQDKLYEEVRKLRNALNRQ